LSKCWRRGTCDGKSTIHPRLWVRGPLEGLANLTEGSTTSLAALVRRIQERKEKLRKQQKAPYINQGKGATWEEKPLHQKRRGGSVRIRRVAGRQASRPLLIGLKVGRMLKRTSGLNKLMSKVHRTSVELESKFLGGYSLENLNLNLAHVCTCYDAQIFSPRYLLHFNEQLSCQFLTEAYCKPCKIGSLVSK